MTSTTGSVLAVHRSPSHTFSKESQPSIRLVAGLGVEGDAHMGSTVKHRSRVAKDPNQPNLRQVHFVPTELHAELAASGFEVTPGLMGENITTEGIDLNELPVGTVLTLGPEAQVELTGLRNPCPQLNGIKQGLMKQLVYNDENRVTVRLAGVMSVVVTSGEVSPGDAITIDLPPEPHRPLDKI